MLSLYSTHTAAAPSFFQLYIHPLLLKFGGKSYELFVSPYERDRPFAKSLPTEHTHAAQLRPLYAWDSNPVLQHGNTLHPFDRAITDIR